MTRTAGPRKRVRPWIQYGAAPILHRLILDLLCIRDGLPVASSCSFGAIEPTATAMSGPMAGVNGLSY